mmetsp:Transcript_3677/g.9813  ORF Transcript_3677/g.9813 Transcript_3677/m.9813 type:complete len:224 (+) Transcript_3677:648-1319(+)
MFSATHRATALGPRACFLFSGRSMRSWCQGSSGTWRCLPECAGYARCLYFLLQLSARVAPPARTPSPRRLPPWRRPRRHPASTRAPSFSARPCVAPRRARSAPPHARSQPRRTSRTGPFFAPTRLGSPCSPLLLGAQSRCPLRAPQLRLLPWHALPTALRIRPRLRRSLVVSFPPLPSPPPPPPPPMSLVCYQPPSSCVGVSVKVVPPRGTTARRPYIWVCVG